MQTGFIQATTNARNARGGEVTVNVNKLNLSANTLLRGPHSRYIFTPGKFGFNVMQLAPESDNVQTTTKPFQLALESGRVRMTAAPSYTLGKWVGLFVDYSDESEVGMDICRIGASGSLVLAGRGGLPESYSGYAHYMLQPVFQDALSESANLEEEEEPDRQADGRKI